MEEEKKKKYVLARQIVKAYQVTEIVMVMATSPKKAHEIAENNYTHEDIVDYVDDLDGDRDFHYYPMKEKDYINIDIFPHIMNSQHCNEIKPEDKDYDEDYEHVYTTKEDYLR